MVVGGGGGASGGDAGAAAGRSTPPPRWASVASVSITVLLAAVSGVVCVRVFAS